MLIKLAKAVAIAVLAISAGATADAQSIKGTIALSGQTQAIAVNFLNNRVYVAIPGSGPTDLLAIIDGKSDSLLSSIDIPPVGHYVAVDVIRDVIYVGGCNTASSGSQECDVAVVNGSTNRVERTIPVTTTEGLGIEGIAVNPLTGKVYIVNASDNVIDVIHWRGTKVQTTIAVSESPLGVSVNPFKNQLYVALSNGSVDVIDAEKDTITTTTLVGGSNAGIATNWVTGNVFVTNNSFGPSTTSVLDNKGNVLANIEVGSTPYGVDVDFGTNLAFVANTQDNTVSVIDGATNTVSSTVPVTGLYVAVNPATEKVYVSGLNNSVTVLNEK